jgi:hypothetical protein
MGMTHQDCLTSWLEVTRGSGEFSDARCHQILTHPTLLESSDFLIVFLLFFLQQDDAKFAKSSFGLILNMQQMRQIAFQHMKCC